MTMHEWQLLKKHTPNYFACMHLYIGIITGAFAGVILLESIIKVLGR
jgi:hypothetical protein